MDIFCFVCVKTLSTGVGVPSPNKRSFDSCQLRAFRSAQVDPLMFTKKNVWKGVRSQGPLQNKQAGDQEAKVTRNFDAVSVQPNSVQKAIPFRNIFYDHIWRDATGMRTLSYFYLCACTFACVCVSFIVALLFAECFLFSFAFFAIILCTFLFFVSLFFPASLSTAFPFMLIF